MNRTKSLIALIVALSLAGGCSMFRNPESEEERQAPRLLDTNKETRKTWYCYGQPDEEWNCRNSPDPSLVRTIEPDRTLPADAARSDLQTAPRAGSVMGSAADTPPLAATVEPAEAALAPDDATSTSEEGTAPDDATSTSEEGTAPDADPLLSLPEDHYTVQLIAMKQEESVLSFARSNGITDPLYTQMSSDGGQWYVLLLGTYPDQQSAIEARDKWQSTRALEAEPWVRRLGPLQQAIRLARSGS